MNPHSILTEFDAWCAWEVRPPIYMIIDGVLTELERLDMGYFADLAKHLAKIKVERKDILECFDPCDKTRTADDRLDAVCELASFLIERIALDEFQLADIRKRLGIEDEVGVK